MTWCGDRFPCWLGSRRSCRGAFWQCAVDQAELSEQQRLEAIEQGWSSRWLVALRQHLHLRLAELESLLAMSEATLARRVRQEGPLEPAVRCSIRFPFAWISGSRVPDDPGSSTPLFKHRPREFRQGHSINTVRIQPWGGIMQRCFVRS